MFPSRLLVCLFVHERISVLAYKRESEKRSKSKKSSARLNIPGRISTFFRNQRICEGGLPPVTAHSIVTCAPSRNCTTCEAFLIASLDCGALISIDVGATVGVRERQKQKLVYSGHKYIRSIMLGVTVVDHPITEHTHTLAFTPKRGIAKSYHKKPSRVM